MAAVLAVGPDAVLSHRDAAAAWELRSTARTAVDVTVCAGARRQQPRITGHVTSALDPEDRTIRDGIPITSVSRTLLDLAEVVPPAQLQRAYETAERLELLDLRAIGSLLWRSNGRHGYRALRDLIGYDPSPAVATRSELERLFLDLLRQADLPPPLVNARVEGHEVDACWPAARLVVELQGYAYHHTRNVFERDHAKLGRLKLAGYDVLPLTYLQVTTEPGWVVDAVRILLARAGRCATL